MTRPGPASEKDGSDPRDLLGHLPEIDAPAVGGAGGGASGASGTLMRSVPADGAPGTAGVSDDDPGRDADPGETVIMRAPQPLEVLGGSAAGTSSPAGRDGATGAGLQAAPGASSTDSLAYQNLERRRRQQHKKKRRKIIVAVCVAAAVVAAILVPRLVAANQEEVTLPATSVVSQGDLVSSVSVFGSAQPVSSVYVTPEVDGIIQDVAVAEGDAVTAGQVLFTLKNDDLDRSVREAQQQVDSAKNQLASAQRGVETAKSAYQKAKAAWDAAADEEARAGLTDPDTLYSEIQNAQDSVTSAQSTLDSASQTLSDAQATAAKRTITAPADGTIVALSAHNGEGWGSATGGTSRSSDAGSQGSLVQIADLSKLRITTQVNEIDISGVQEGQPATVTFSALPGLTLDARVEHIATVSSSDSNGEGVVTYPVDLIIDAPDSRIKPGMTASATIQTQNVAGVLIVPLGALQDYDEAAGTATVSVVTLDDEGQIASSEQVPVSVTATNGSDAAVEGVDEGSVVELVDEDSSSSDADADGDAAYATSAEG